MFECLVIWNRPSCRAKGDLFWVSRSTSFESFAALTWKREWQSSKQTTTTSKSCGKACFRCIEFCPKVLYQNIYLVGLCFMRAVECCRSSLFKGKQSSSTSLLWLFANFFWWYKKVACSSMVNTGFRMIFCCCSFSSTVLPVICRRSGSGRSFSSGSAGSPLSRYSRSVLRWYLAINTNDRFSKRVRWCSIKAPTHSCDRYRPLSMAPDQLWYMSVFELYCESRV